ncbi:DUF6447 family protein [Prochlorococcus sp. AH-716-N14]|nr:DUF6447 family protein [Prochlorococcus sp. AH-716-N14]
MTKGSDSANPENKKPPTLDFDGKKFNINLLPAEVNDLLKSLQISDTQIRMYKDTLRLLELEKNSLGGQLNQKLEHISPVEY